MIEIERVYYICGALDREIYYTNGILHRKNGPSYIGYNKLGNVIYIGYTNSEGTRHKVYGPAIIYYKLNGGISQISWYYNGIDYKNEVENWLEENNIELNEMTEYDYDRMWMEVL